MSWDGTGTETGACAKPEKYLKTRRWLAGLAWQCPWEREVLETERGSEFGRQGPCRGFPMENIWGRWLAESQPDKEGKCSGSRFLTPATWGCAFWQFLTLAEAALARAGVWSRTWNSSTIPLGMLCQASEREGEKKLWQERDSQLLLRIKVHTFGLYKLQNEAFSQYLKWLKIYEL